MWKPITLDQFIECFWVKNSVGLRERKWRIHGNTVRGSEGEEMEAVRKWTVGFGFRGGCEGDEGKKMRDQRGRVGFL